MTSRDSDPSPASDSAPPTPTENARGEGAPQFSGAPRGPITDSMKKPLPKRFYKAVTVQPTTADRTSIAPYAIHLDAKAVKTPGKRPLSLPTRALAEAIAAEWAAQDALVDPATMPLTRFANTAIDAVADNAEAVAADIVAYAGSDLVCYRAESPDELVHLQHRHWSPIVEWAREALTAHFTVARGVMPVVQPPAALAAFAAALAPHDAYRLTALHVMTTLTGSAMIALAHARGFLALDEAWTAAHVDEDYQASLWGTDAQAADRREGRFVEFAAASRFVDLLT